MAEQDRAAAGRLTTTSFALLCLLAVQPWSSYELTRQMDRSLGRMWPRATSKLYEEPKKLVRHGLASARTERGGLRVRTVYSITDAGRRALAEWMALPGGGPVLEFEGLLKVGFAEFGTRADALATLASVREWAAERNEENSAAAHAYAAGAGPFQERAAQAMVVGGFLTAYYRMVRDWADWATGVVERWPDHPGDARADLAQLAEFARRAEW